MYQKNKGRFWGCMVLFVMSFILYAPHLSTRALASEKGDIKSAVEEKLSGNNIVKKIFFLDFDKDGRKEAFVLSGKPNNNSDYDDGVHLLWFGYYDDGKAIVTQIANNIVISAHTLKLTSQTFFCAGTYVTTSYPEDMYQVRGNTVKIIFTGDSIDKYNGNSFVSVHSAYDAISNGTGHTWKPYYYYYKNGKIYRYNAKQISLNELKRYNGALKYLKQIKKTGYKVSNVLYRSNGLIHINVKKKEGSLFYYNNVTLTIKGKKVKLLVNYKKGKNIIDKSGYGGIYQK